MIPFLISFIMIASIYYLLTDEDGWHDDDSE